MNDPNSMPADELDRRLDAALRRRFAAPADLDTLAERLRPRERARLGRWTLLALAAALLAGLVLWRSRDARPAPVPARAELVARSGSAPRPPAADAPFCRLIGPVLDGQPAAGLQRPDLERLYREMDACQRDTSEAACGAADLLAERMSATYGQPLELRPEAAGLLHGPFGSDQWPTGTIVTGSTGERTAVLVADRSSTLDCCVHVQLPEDSGLRLFTWQVGEVVLTEITPFEEPRLLRYFE